MTKRPIKKSLSRRLALTTATVAGTVVFLATVFYIFQTYSAEKQRIVEMSQLIAMTAADYSASDLAFSDQEAAQETLITLSKLPNIVDAKLTASNGALFASLTDHAIPPEFTALEPPAMFIDESLLYVSASVTYKAKSYGTLYIVVSVAHLLNSTIRVAVVTALVLGVLVIFSYYFAKTLQRTITEPVLRLAQFAREIGETGRSQKSFTHDSDDEIGFLTQSFSNMSSLIEMRERARDQAVEALRVSERRIRLLLDATAEAIYGLNAQGECILINPSCVRMLGFDTADQLLGFDMHARVHAPPKNENATAKSNESCLFCQTLLKKVPKHSADAQLWKRDGSPLPVEFWSYPIVDDAIFNGVVVSFLDISERKTAQREIEKHRLHLEELVSERTKQLESVNAELEAFSYSVSHDLRAPLRSLDGFSKILMDDYYNQLDPTANDYLQRIRRSSQRMGELIEDMLGLSRVTRYAMKLQDIDLSALATEILSTFAMQSPDRTVEVIVQPDLVVRGDLGLMRIALENLLSNAWKYSQHALKPTIEVGLQDNEGESEYFVRDNGAGFDMEYAHNLFKPFQRLHNLTDYPGSGIGLAIVQRVIKRHNGRIWAHATPNQGATFFFTVSG